MRKSHICLVTYHHIEAGIGRPRFARDALQSMAEAGEVTIISSDFEHLTKRSLGVATRGVIRVPVRPYRTNISAARFLSYVDFARRVRTHPALVSADLIYVCVPDYLSAVVVLSGAKRRGQKVVIDVVDLWPEALPLPRFASGFMKGTVWQAAKFLRWRLFQGASLVLFQSEYFLRAFGGEDGRYRLLRMCSDGGVGKLACRGPSSLGQEIRVLFLGSMNHITDTRALSELLSRVAERRAVRLTVIGGGSSLEWLQQQLSRTQVRTTYHGVTFDEQLKEDELRRADFGFNGYKLTTEVAVSYKSMEYLQHGVPLINSAKGDTYDLVERERCGLNFDARDLGQSTERILGMTDAEHATLVANAYRSFESNFSLGQFSATLTSYLRPLL